MFNLPEGNYSYLDDCNMICQHCDRKDDVDNGEYHNHMWYCDECFKELFKVCPKCNVSVISVDEEMCEDCLAEKTYDESAEGMFDNLGYSLEIYRYLGKGYLLKYSKGIISIAFDLEERTYSVSEYTYKENEGYSIASELHQAITQQMKELGWL